jgi:hypothetical protein
VASSSPRVVLSDADMVGDGYDARRPLEPHEGPLDSIPLDLDFRYDFDELGRQQDALDRMYPEIFGRTHFDPEALCGGYFVHPEIRAAAEDTIPAFRDGQMKLAMHPWLRRVCIWEREGGAAGEGPENWHVKQIFMGATRPGYLPADLDDFDHRQLRGLIGDFVQPDRAWFEWFREHADREFTSRGLSSNLARNNGCAPFEGIRRILKAKRDARWESANRDMRNYEESLASYMKQGLRDAARVDFGAGWASSRAFGESLEKKDESRGRAAHSLWDIEKTDLGTTVYRRRPSKLKGLAYGIERWLSASERGSDGTPLSEAQLGLAPPEATLERPSTRAVVVDVPAADASSSPAPARRRLPARVKEG